MTDTAPGNLFIVAAPSGGGKTSLVNLLVRELPNINVSISHTTRSQRPGETDGVHYFFIAEDRFLQMIDDGAFVEYARVFGHWYGTSVQQIHDRLQMGTDIVLDIDWQGAQQIKKEFPNAVSIFVIPPSLDVLKKRLQDRQQDDEAVISHRMQRAHDEVCHYHEFDYLIVNDDFKHAATELQAIIIANRLRMSRQSVIQRKLLSFLLTAQ